MQIYKTKYGSYFRTISIQSGQLRNILSHNTLYSVLYYLLGYETAGVIFSNDASLKTQFKRAVKTGLDRYPKKTRSHNSLEKIYLCSPDCTVDSEITVKNGCPTNEKSQYTTIKTLIWPVPPCIAVYCKLILLSIQTRIILQALGPKHH